MQYAFQKKYSMGQQLLIFIGLILAGTFIAAIIQEFFLVMMAPGKIDLKNMDKELPKILNDPRNVQSVRLLQLVSTLLMLFLPAYLFSRIVMGKGFFWMGFNKHINSIQIALGAVIIFLAGVMASPLEQLTKLITAYYPSLDAVALRMENTYNETVAALGSIKSWQEFLISVFVMAFFPALFEEVFFRGVAQQFFVRWTKKPVWAIVIASVIFSLVHASIYLFLSRFVLGMALGLMFYHTRNLWVNIIAHFLNNTIVLVIMFYSSSQKIQTPENEIFSTPYDYWLAGASVFVLIYLTLLLKRKSQINVSNIEKEESNLLQKQFEFPPI